MFRLVFKLVWLGLGLFGVFTLVKPYFPEKGLIKGIQGNVISRENPVADFSGGSESLNLDRLKNLDLEQAAAVVSRAVQQEVVKILQTTTTEIKEFPQKQVKKIKIGACEELLEEDICAVARELKCQ